MRSPDCARRGRRAAALGPEQPSYTADPARLAALRAGEPVDIAASDLPPHARAGVACPWWRRAVVDADGAVQFYDNDGAAWLAENGLWAEDALVNGMPTGASLFVWLPDRRAKWLGHSSYVLTLTTYADYIPEAETENPLPEPVAATRQEPQHD